MKKLVQVKNFLEYVLTANGTGALHSSVSELAEIFEDQRVFYAFTEIESIRQELLINDEKLKVTDFGAGSKHLDPATRRIGDIAQHTAIPPKYGRLLFRMVNRFQPKTILEIGTGLGIGTMYLGSASKNAQLITLEGSHSIAVIARKNFSQLGLKNSRLQEGLFKDTLPNALDELRKIDLLFIDGHHDKAATISYFQSCLPFLHEKSIVVLDDINWSKDMNEAWHNVKENAEVSMSVDLFRMGILFFDRGYPRQNLRLRF